MENLNVDFALTNNKVQFTAVSRSNPDWPVNFDYVPPLGDGQGLLGLEALVMSFCGCVSTAIVGLLYRGGKHVAKYAGTATGIRRENPLSLAKIIFEIQLESDNTEAADMDRIMDLAAKTSPVWLAIQNNVEVEAKYQITLGTW
jgi:organic hydroperoxide reductase OsmC/OhrA